jgi:hypothetical protein
MWVKRGALTSTYYGFFGKTINASANFALYFDASTDRVLWTFNNTNYMQSNAVYRDVSAWYHFVFVWDSANATAAQRARIYVNGVEITSWAVDNRSAITTSMDCWNTNDLTYPHTLAANSGSPASSYFDGYMAEVYFVDGQALTPSSFGETDAVTGVWKPKKYGGTYGTNGFYLNFSDNSSNTAATIGKDYSGNGNNWTPNNISVTSGVTYDSMLDVPTQWADGGNGRGNYAVMNPLAVTAANSTITNGNLQVVTPNVGGNAFSTFAIPASGKWYFEVTPTSGTGNAYIGVSAYTVGSTYLWQNTNHVFYTGGGQKSVDGSASSYGASYADNDVIGVACDSDAGTITFYKNNTSQGSISHTMTDMIPALTDGASASGVTFQTNFGQRPFSYTPPTGFKALNTFNLPDSTIKAGNKHFDTLLWTSNASVKSVTGSAFQPDLVWVKDRQSASANEGYHHLVDSVRGAGKVLSSNSTTTEYWSGTNNSVTAFNSNGFSSGIFDGLNGDSMVSWLWKAGNGSSSNTDGSITSTVSVNATAGFSIASFTNVPAVASAYTVGHGLGVAPKLVIVKKRTANADSWFTYHASVGNTAYLALESTAGATTSLIWSNTSPTSTTFTIRGGSFSLGLSDTFIAYCFSEVAGFSRMGNYQGNGSSDGSFVYCGFRPRWIMVKRTDSISDWRIIDTARDTYNVASAQLYPDLANAEASGAMLDVLSNGFKIRNTDTGYNASGGTFIYAAFAENPYKLALAR